MVGTYNKVCTVAVDAGEIEETRLLAIWIKLVAITRHLFIGAEHRERIFRHLLSEVLPVIYEKGVIYIHLF